MLIFLNQDPTTEFHPIMLYKTHEWFCKTVFPNIIMNKVDYSSVQIPNYLGLSNTHALKIKTSIKEYYAELKPLYGVSSINKILTTIQKSCKNIVKLSKETPYKQSFKHQN